MADFQAIYPTVMILWHKIRPDEMFIDLGSGAFGF